MTTINEVENLIRPWVSSPDECRALATAIMGLVEPDAASTGVRGGNHALLVGRILGVLMKDDSEARSMGPLRPHPVMAGVDGKDYSNKISVTQPSGEYIITVEPVGIHRE